MTEVIEPEVREPGAPPVAVEDGRDLLDVERVSGLVREEPLGLAPPAS
jgi:hypothetical protein